MDFNSDSKHLAYAMRDGALQKLAYCDAQSLKICPTGPPPKFFAVLDAQTGAKFDGVGYLNSARSTRRLPMRRKQVNCGTWCPEATRTCNLITYWH